MNRRGNVSRLLCFALIVLCASLVLSGCSSGKVKGEAPFAQVSSWRLDGDTLGVELRLRNVNDEALSISAVTLQVTADENVSLMQITKTFSINIPAGGFETLPIQATASEAGLALLDSLAREERASVAYRLEGTVNSPAEGRLQFRHDGHIYRVPGRPGEFR